MNETIFETKVNGILLIITEKYIQYGSLIMPVSALSFISNENPLPKWLRIILWFTVIACFLLSIFFLAAGIFLALIATLPFAIILLIILVVYANRQYINFYSHSQNIISIIWDTEENGNIDVLYDAIFELVEPESLSQR